MRNGWYRTEISEVAVVQSGSGFPKRYQGRVGEEIPFYKVSDMNTAGNERLMIHENNSVSDEIRQELGASLIPAGSTIFPKIGGAISTNKKRLTATTCCVDNNVMGVIPDPDKISADFLHYFFLSHDLSEFANKAHLPSIRKTVVEGWDISLPRSLREQQRIVGLLDEAFDGLATARAHAEQNLANARALFESHLDEVFTEGGEGWVEKSLGEVCEIARGGSPRPIKKFITTASDGINWIKIGDATASGKYIYDTKQKIIPEGASKSRIVRNGDFLLSNSMSFGRPYIMRTTGCIHDGWLVLSDYAQHLEQDYLYYVLGSHFVFQQFDSLAAGSTVRNLNIGLASQARIPIPPIEQQKEIAQRFDALIEETQRLEALYQQKLDALDELKQSLLHQAFSGQL